MEPGDCIRRILEAIDSGELSTERLAEASWHRLTDPRDVTGWLEDLGLGSAELGSTEADRSTTVAWDGPSADRKTPETPTITMGPNGRATAPKPGDRSSADRYEIDASRHGRGGIGEVWRAHDRWLDRQVAIKRLRPDRLGLTATRQRFHREAQITAKLQHPGIVPVFDLMAEGSEGGGGPWYTMRFVAGRTLARATRDYHENGRREDELRRLIEALIAVCQTIAYAHASDVLHRDVKGDNVILGDFGEVFVLDWGLAKQVGGLHDGEPPTPNVDDPELTIPGSRLGTPAYMAPEVARGALTTRQSDIYSLGAILYAILAGRPPYQGTTPEEIVQNVDHNPPPPPIEVNPRASRPLDAICRKAMARERANRYASALELADDLRHWLDDQPIAAYRDPWSVRVSRWIRKHRTASATAATFVIVTLLSLAAVSVLLAQANRKTEEAWDEAEQRFQLARNVVGQMLVEATERDLPPIVEAIALRRNLNRLTVDLQRDLARRKPEDRSLALEAARAESRAGDISRSDYETREAETYYEQAQDRLKPLAANPSPRDGENARLLLASTFINRADLEILRGTPTHALRFLDAADLLIDPAIANAAGSLDDRNQAGRSRLSRAAVLEALGRTDEARATIEAAWRHLDQSRRHPTSPLLLLLVDCHRAVLRAATEPEAARTIATQNVEKTATILSRNPEDMVVQHLHATTLKALGRTLIDVGDRTAAESSLAEAVAILSKLVDRSRRSPRFLDDLTEAQRDLGRSRRDKAAEATRTLMESIANGRELVERYPEIHDFQDELALGLAAVAAINHDVPAREEALRRLNAGLERCPNNPDFLAARQALTAGTDR